jgi:hypothetical protein
MSCYPPHHALTVTRLPPALFLLFVSSRIAILFTWKLVVMAFDTDKSCGMVAIDQVAMEKN